MPRRIKVTDRINVKLVLSKLVFISKVFNFGISTKAQRAWTRTTPKADGLYIPALDFLE